MQRVGLYGRFTKNLRGKKGQQGFTLIELLVVVTILGVLAAIVTLSLVGLTTNANTQACNTEYKTVQAAIDLFMADNQLDVLPAAQTALTRDMTGGSPVNPGDPNNGTLKLYNPNPSAGSPNYTRNGVTQFAYTWDTSGRILQIATASGGAVAGCIPR